MIDSHYSMVKISILILKSYDFLFFYIYLRLNYSSKRILQEYSMYHYVFHIYCTPFAFYILVYIFCNNLFSLLSTYLNNFSLF